MHDDGVPDTACFNERRAGLPRDALGTICSIDLEGSVRGREIFQQPEIVKHSRDESQFLVEPSASVRYVERPKYVGAQRMIDQEIGRRPAAQPVRSLAYLGRWQAHARNFCGVVTRRSGGGRRAGCEHARQVADEGAASECEWCRHKLSSRVSLLSLRSLHAICAPWRMTGGGPKS